MQKTPSAPVDARWLLPLMTAGLAAGILIGRTATGWALAAVGLGISLILAFLMQGWQRSIACTLCAACAGCLLGVGAYSPELPAAREYVISGVVTQEISLRDDGQVQTVLDNVTLDGTPAGTSAYWTYYLGKDEVLPDALVPGAHVSFTGRVYHPSGEANPGGFDFREYLLQRGIHFGVYGAEDMRFPAGKFSLSGVMAGLRHVLTQKLMAVMGPEAGAYAAAMLLGERNFIPYEDSQAFRRLGIAHILSVSGYHVGVLVGLLTWLLRPLRMKRSHRLTCTSVLLALYCMLTGGAAPVIRAGLLYVLWESGHLRGRQNLPLHTLCLSATVQLFFRPPLVTSASFQLTYGAMLGMLLVRPVLRRKMRSGHALLDKLGDVLSASLAAHLGILPAQIYWFREVPLLSLLANVAIMGVASAVMALYWLTLFLVGVPGVNALIGGIAAAATEILLGGVRLLGSIEGTSLWIRQANLTTLLGWMLVMLGLSTLLPRRKGRLRRQAAGLGAVIMAVSLIPAQHTGVTYTQFSVGEADAALLRDGNTVVLIDTGEDGQSVSGYLHQQRLDVDMLVLTHLHLDHAGGLRALLDDGIPVDVCYLPVGAALAEDVDEEAVSLVDELAATGTEIRTLSRGDTVALPSGTLHCLWPSAEALRPLDDANHTSLTLLADIGGVTMLLTGDLTSRYETYAAHPADILKAAHHGSAGSTSEAFLAEVDPRVVILSCGKEARRESLAKRTGEIPLYDTNSCGAVTIRFLEDRFTVETYLPKEDAP